MLNPDSPLGQGPEPTTIEERARWDDESTAAVLKHEDILAPFVQMMCGRQRRLIADLDRALAMVKELAEAHGILEQFKRQQERWKKPMPGLDGENAVFIWCLKAQEELGELSAALLGRLIGKEGRGDPLEEVDQLIAVLLRVRTALPESASGEKGTP